MTEPISSRQQVLQQLWDAPIPHAVWVILEREAAARADDIAAELPAQSATAHIDAPNSPVNGDGGLRAKPNGNGNGNGKSASALTKSGAAEIALRAALTASIDAALAAEQYASAHGLSIRFGSEDLRAMALSLFIQHARDGGVR